MYVYFFQCTITSIYQQDWTGSVILHFLEVNRRGVTFDGYIPSKLYENLKDCKITCQICPIYDDLSPPMWYTLFFFIFDIDNFLNLVMRRFSS